MTNTEKQLIRALVNLRDAMQEALHTHIYDVDNGDVVEPNCHYQKVINDADAVLRQVLPSCPKNTARAIL